MSSLYSEWTSFNNRANRLELWIVSIITAGLSSAFAMLAKSFVMSGYLMNMMISLGPELTIYPFILICAIAAILLYVPVIATRVRRLHDFNLSGYWLLPFYGAIIAFMTLRSIIDGTILKSDAFQFIRDLDNHTTNIIVIVILVIILFYLIVLYLLPGSRGTNQYGGDEREINRFVKKRIAETKANKKKKKEKKEKIDYVS